MCKNLLVLGYSDSIGRGGDLEMAILAGQLKWHQFPVFCGGNRMSKLRCHGLLEL